MSNVAEELHSAFLLGLTTRGAVASHGDLREKPLAVDLHLPHPQRLRVYAYALVGGFGTTRPNEYKVSVRVPGQPVGEYGSFDYAEDRLVLMVGYRGDLDVFVLWDASLHPRFKNGGNIQVRADTVHVAAARTRAVQLRNLSSGTNEVVIACQSSNLLEAITCRVAWTGGVAEGEWVTSPS